MQHKEGKENEMRANERQFSLFNGLNGFLARRQCRGKIGLRAIPCQMQFYVHLTDPLLCCFPPNS